MTLKRFTGLILLLLAFACSKEPAPSASKGAADGPGHWLVPFEYILYWGDPADEIVSIDNPEFIKASEGRWEAGERMIVLHLGEVVRAYPVNVLEGHEIINDRIGDSYFAVSYCPITGSGIVWDRTINGGVTEFGVSGMLYHENLVPYDRNTNSYWSQMLMLCIHGELIETNANALTFFETDFELVSTHFPDAELLVGSTDSIPCNCTGSEYKDVRDEIEPGPGSVDALDPGTYYFGIVGREDVLLFSKDLFEGDPTVFLTAFRGQQLIVLGSKEKNYFVSYELGGAVGQGMTPVTSQFPVVMEDVLGNRFDVFGVVVSGPDTGTRLKAASAYRAKGFAWSSIFKRKVLFEE